MSNYKAGDRVRIDEGLPGNDDWPYTGIGRLLYKSNSASPYPALWQVDVEYLVTPEGDMACQPGDSYSVWENEIAEVLND